MGLIGCKEGFSVLGWAAGDMGEPLGGILGLCDDGDGYLLIGTPYFLACRESVGLWLVNQPI